MADELQDWARRVAHKTAWMLADGSNSIDYSELDNRSNKAAQLLQSLDLLSGNVIAINLPNCAEFFELTWAARRLGLYYTPISTRLTLTERSYIARDCEAKVLFTNGADSFDFEGRVVQVGPDDASSSSEYTALRDSFKKCVDLPEVPLGKDFVYSSGTTGQPKGVKRPLFSDPQIERNISDWIQAFSRHTYQSVCLVPAPLYHAAPLRFAMRSMQHGGTVIGMARFDAETALAAIDRHKVTHSLWVPTMFYRMLALHETIRDTYDVTSMECAIHSGGPCAYDLKRRMIDWWGPIIWEYYGASEGNGATCISPQEALNHPGSVGRAVLGKVHILGPAGEGLPVGSDGDIYFEGGPTFEYHGDPEKTLRSRNIHGWTTVGDIGHLDAEGYLYLSDRKAYTIISGGVNIYPAEIEHVLCAHPAIADAAVFGIPNDEFGEVVKAVVELNPEYRPSDDLAEQLITYCRNALSPAKRPKSISFEPKIPREENGKLYKAELKSRYSKKKN